MSISDIIEAYLKEVLKSEGDEMIEIKRNEMANHFECVPSQINYVINTRFTLERGYLIESKRGGGGYIRIIRIEHRDDSHLIDDIISIINPVVSEDVAENVLERLSNKEIITEREEKIILSVIDSETLAVELPYRDKLRARILTNVFNTLKYIKQEVVS